MRTAFLFILLNVMCGIYIDKPVFADEKKSVCVMSDIGQQLALKKIGIMVFGNTYKAIPISHWKFDDRVYATLKKTLGDKFKLKQIKVPEDAFKSLEGQGGLFRDTEGEIKAIVRKLADGVSCDYDFYLTAGSSAFGSSNQFVGGLGIVETESLLFGNRNLHALSYVRIYDGKTMDILNRQRVRQGFNLFGGNIQGPHHELDIEAHPSLEATAEDPKTKDILWGLLEKALIDDTPEFFEFLQRPVVASGKEKWDPFARD